MKRFYRSVLLFVLPIAMFMGGAEYMVRQIPNEYKYKNDWMDQHAKEVETLILGNSHTQTGINPDLLDGNAFNLSISGQDYIYSSFLFFKWADRLKKLKTLIMPVSYFSFYKTPHGDDSVLLEELYYHLYMKHPFFRYNIAYNIEALYYKPFVSKVGDFMCNKAVKWKSNGWYPLDYSNKTDVWNADRVNKPLAKKYLADSLKYGNINRNYGYVAEIARFCKKRGIRLVLVSTPQTKEYNNCLNHQQIMRTNGLVERLKREYGIEYYDYREDYSFGEVDFFDQSHLSEFGADKLTKFLIVKLLSRHIEGINGR